MPFDALEYTIRSEAIKTLRDKHSLMAGSAFDYVDGAIWLIGGSRIPQALSLLHNAIELMLKAELESIHRALIADQKKMKYSDLKAILRDAFLSHPKGANVSVPDFDFDRTIAFPEALERVSELYPEIFKKWNPHLNRLHKFRNDIVHYGPDDALKSKYIEDIVLTAFPFIKLFADAAYPVKFEDLVMKRIDRELSVSFKVTEKLKKEKSEITFQVLKTVYFVTTYNASYFAEFVDKDGFIVFEGDREFELSEQCRQEFEKDGYYVDDDERSCLVCGNFQIFISYDLFDEKTKEVRAVAARCPKCGFDISKKNKYLAHFHFGEVPEDKKKIYLKNIGEFDG